MLDRRQIISGFLVLPLIGCATKNGSALAKPRTFVLVHGAWHGGWAWIDVKAHLEAEGHHVFTPTLSGLGSDAGNLTPQIGLDTHIDDVLRVFEDNQLADVTLVGHSYGGMVITGVVDRIPSAISRIVYLDSIVPHDGRSMSNVGPAVLPDVQAQIDAGLKALSKDGVAMEPLPPEAFGIPTDHPKYDWVAENLSPHPLKTWFDPIRLSENPLGTIDKVFIHCVEPVLKPSSIPAFATKAKADPTWEYHELMTGHDAMITAYEDVAKLL